DMWNNRIMQLKADSSPVIVSPMIGEPEGIVALPDGTLIVVEQATNRLYHLDPATQEMELFYAVGNATKNDGIDGLGYDAVTGDFLIPDAPTGRILRLSSDAKKLELIATGFKRPTSVALAKDGTLYVCDEYGDGIYQISVRGKRSIVAAISFPDDVLLDGDGNLIVNSLEGNIWRINPKTREASRLVIGLGEPHGIALDSKGDLIIADATKNRIYRLAFRDS